MIAEQEGRERHGRPSAEANCLNPASRGVIRNKFIPTGKARTIVVTMRLAQGDVQPLFLGYKFHNRYEGIEQYLRAIVRLERF